jgi:hypothetical protein
MQCHYITRQRLGAGNACHLISIDLRYKSFQFTPIPITPFRPGTHPRRKSRVTCIHYLLVTKIMFNCCGFPASLNAMSSY